MTGYIRKLLFDKGCGFIRTDHGDYFFHASGLQTMTLPYAQLQEGMQVEFTPLDAPKGPRAIEVRVQS